MFYRDNRIDSGQDRELDAVWGQRPRENVDGDTGSMSVLEKSRQEKVI